MTKKESTAPADGAVTQEERVNWFKLLRYADAIDYLLLFLGLMGSFATGVAFPLFSIVFGDLLDKLGSPGAVNLQKELQKLCLYFTGLAFGSFLASYVQVTCWMATSARQANRIRQLYLDHMLHQDVEFFDVQASSGTLLQGITTDVTLIQVAISDRMGLFLQNVTSFVVGIILAFTRSWQITLVGLSVAPVMGVTGWLLGMATTTIVQKANKAYVSANNTASESLSNIRTVASLQLEEGMVRRYAARLIAPYKAGVFQAWAVGITQGTFDCVIYGAFAAIIYYGAVRVSKNQNTGGDVIATLFCVVIGAFGLAQGMPLVRHLDNGRVAGARVFKMLQRQPRINTKSGEGLKPSSLRGEIELQSVDFNYPSRPDIPIFQDFSLKIPAGTSMALVGPSGSGKSSTVSLVLRFYDPLAGTVLVDGVDVKKLNLQWLRSQIGYVNQEPVIFAGTIMENLLQGRRDATEEEVYSAARVAMIHDLIMTLPNGYETFVGEKGVALSGGQRQRVAIARAILRNPRILLLDEATSALDSETERQVQEGLDRLMVGRTSIIVAHRLSTIRNATSIAVVQGGKVVEMGPHFELMARGGVYWGLVKTTESKQEEEEEEEEESDRESSILPVGAEPGALAPIHHHAPEAEDDTRKRRTSFVVEVAASVAERLPRKSLATELPATLIGLRKSTLPAERSGEHGGTGQSLEYQRASLEAVDDSKDGKKGGKKKKEPKPKYFKRLLAMNRDQLPAIALGGLASAVYGTVMPVFSYVLSYTISIFYRNTAKGIRDGGAQWAAVYAGLGGATLICGVVQQRALGGVAQAVAMRIRIKIFEALLKMDIGFFDYPDHSSGALSGQLQQDALHVRGALGDATAVILQNMATLLAGYGIAFYGDWRITLLVSACLPFLAIGGYFQSLVQLGWEGQAGEAFQKANTLATSAFENIRVITAFGLQGDVINLYNGYLDEPSRKLVRNSHGLGAGYGLSNFAQYAVYALAFFVGGKLVDQGKITFTHLLTAFFAILLAGIGLTQAQLQFPDLGKATKAVQNVFNLIDRKSLIQPGTKELDKCDGEIVFEQVRFKYPLRPNITVLHRLDLRMPAGKAMALVGESGSGKSTIVSLVLRFYDPVSGSIRLDGVDLRDLSLTSLRRWIGLVGQEPALFEGTIRENIANGRQGASDEDVFAAARAANIAGFIEGLPDKYDTPLGERGAQLSGGQKQRVAIARAVLRNPRVLLLDEATSALDAESERVVQEALDKLMAGRTSVIVAHRLSTIRNADCISVFKRGYLVEQGTHEELMGKKGGYYATKLAASQGVQN